MTEQQDIEGIAVLLWSLYLHRQMTEFYQVLSTVDMARRGELARKAAAFTLTIFRSSQEATR